MHFYAEDDKNKDYDRILELRPIEGATSKSASGAVDKRLFNGENKLHAKMDEQTCLWSFSYDKGVLPGGLSDQFTSFPRALDHAKRYFKNRNIEIVEVID